MNIKKRIENKFRELAKAHKERSSHHADTDETLYWEAHMRLHMIQDEIEILCKIRSLTRGKVLPETEKAYACPTRYESLPGDIQDKIDRLEIQPYRRNSYYVYFIPGIGIAKSLKDAVAYASIK